MKEDKWCFRERFRQEISELIFGANLGGNLTPIGSASTLVAVTIMHKQKLNLSFAGFVKVAFPYAIVQLVLATIYVLAFLT